MRTHSQNMGRFGQVKRMATLTLAKNLQALPAHGIGLDTVKRLNKGAVSKKHLLQRIPATSIFTVKESYQAFPWPLPQQVLATRSIINSHQGILIQNVNLSFSGSWNCHFLSRMKEKQSITTLNPFPHSLVKQRRDKNFLSFSILTKRRSPFSSQTQETTESTLFTYRSYHAIVFCSSLTIQLMIPRLTSHHCLVPPFFSPAAPQKRISDLSKLS